MSTADASRGGTARKLSFLQWLVIHPLLVAATPILLLFRCNIREYSLDVVYRPLVVACVAACAVWLVARLLTGEWRKSAIMCSWITLLFFSYGRVASHLTARWGAVEGARLHAAQLLLPASAVTLAVAAWPVLRRLDPQRLTTVANVISVMAFVVQAGGIARFRIANARLPRYCESENAVIASLKAPDTLPNIYCIVLDGYARFDTLRDVYGYNNSEFEDYLRGKGFYIAGKARSSYPYTILSLASLLNMTYLDGLASRVGADCQDAAPLYHMLRQNRVRRLAAACGYRFVAFASGYHPTDLTDADAYMAPPEQRREFVTGILGTTPLLSPKTNADNERRCRLYAFDNIPRFARSPEPTFVFAHILAPHPPYLFERDGSPADVDAFPGTSTGNRLICRGGLTRSEAMQRYVDQLIFVNDRTKAMISRLLADSRVPPIIILQSDHGPCSFLSHDGMQDTYLQERMTVLSAYFMPGGDNGLLHEDISPVNAFRVLFNRYFGTSMLMLPDKSYYATGAALYRHTDVTNEIGSASDRVRYERLRKQPYFSNDDEPEDALKRGRAKSMAQGSR
jgi:hypothetical protein